MAVKVQKIEKLQNIKELTMSIGNELLDLVTYAKNERIYIPDLALCSEHLANGLEEIQDMIERIEVAN